MITNDWPRGSLNGSGAFRGRLLRLPACEEHDDDEHGGGCGGAEDVHGQAACAQRVDEREQDAGDDERREPEAGHERKPAKALSRFTPHLLALLERPVPELGGNEQARPDERRGSVERRVVDDQLGSVQAAEEEEGTGDERRPTQDERGEEHDEPDNRDAHADLERELARPCKRDGCEPGRARERRDPESYARASLA